MRAELRERSSLWHGGSGVDSSDAAFSGADVAVTAPDVSTSVLGGDHREPGQITVSIVDSDTLVVETVQTRAPRREIDASPFERIALVIAVSIQQAKEDERADV